MTWPSTRAFKHKDVGPQEKRQILPLYREDIIPNTINNATLMARKEGQYFLIFLLKFGLARPGHGHGHGRVAVIRPEHAYRGRPPRKSTFYWKLCFRVILVISGPSRPQKWIRLEILRWKMVSGGLEVKIKAISWQIYDFVYKLDIQPESPGHLVLQGVVAWQLFSLISVHPQTPPCPPPYCM